MKNILTALMLTTATFAAHSQEKTMPLYPKGVPNSKPTPATYKEVTNSTNWISKVSVPTITPYLPAAGTANGSAIIVFPGGGYVGLANAHEGMDIAKAFSNIGVTAFLVKYRLPSDSIMVDKTIGPLQDAQRAVQIVRQGAAKWNIDANRIGIIGFSAGGHLASTLGTHFEKAVIDNKEGTSLRPDFMMLIYPVITFGEKTHSGSKENLIGKNPSQELVDLYSNEKQVKPNTPPAFIIHAEDDTVVPIENAMMMYEALLANKVKTEMHFFQAGGHGFGMPNSTTKEKWFDWAQAWMEQNEWLKK
ncbi:alpha/beta hydrolase [Mucilaginibacter pedocola]|uniref:1,4-beta-xylanase n=1 Tax=Mucilaginibacter pedocola TaxID=1792845 RepID=A0A1S9P8F4_9SPHI|nr:alpha/beta hydrolase [Mucilaginibacter pedocola]OOQ57241.1 1,4-beta-xylanase [Mucilaginibacter pedocola]